MQEFTLHPTLVTDTINLGHMPLCHVRLMNESQFPWLILVPSRNNITELHNLSALEQTTLIKETSSISESLLSNFKADKINIGALGNVVPQFHMHVIARYKHDPAWPGPTWGNFSPLPYSSIELEKHINQLTRLLSDNICGFTRC